MATRSTGGDPTPRSIRFSKENDRILSAASAVQGDSINSLVNKAVESYFAQPLVVDTLRASYTSFVNETNTYQDTINKLAGGSSC